MSVPLFDISFMFMSTMNPNEDNVSYHQRNLFFVSAEIQRFIQIYFNNRQQWIIALSSWLHRTSPQAITKVSIPGPRFSFQYHNSFSAFILTLNTCVTKFRDVVSHIYSKMLVMKAFISHKYRTYQSKPYHCLCSSLRTVFLRFKSN